MPVLRASRFWRQKGHRLNTALAFPSVLLLFFAGCTAEPRQNPGSEKQMGEFIRVSDDGKHFVFSDSGLKFTPWGFNYDHDRSNRLLEYYWKEEWNTVVADFREMKALGANTVRIHLQVSRFMKSAQEL